MSSAGETKRKILVVDDDQSFSRMIQLLIARQGHEVQTSPGVEDAKKKLGDDGSGFNLIVLDLMMPEQNGFDFLNWKDATKEAIKSIPVLINTAKKVSEEERNFLEPRSKFIVEKGMDFTSTIVKKVSEALSG
ncbi:MAG TPA: response regulator [Victivallales bacterium]|nr:response regulator [Victivallales bacterium]